MAYLLSKGARVRDDRDSAGNTALHMTVIHTRPKMYDYLAEEVHGAGASPAAAGAAPTPPGRGKSCSTSQIAARRQAATANGQRAPCV